MCVRASVLGKGRRAEDGNVFFSKQERLLNPCLLEQGGLGVVGGGVHSVGGDSGIWMA